jgi:hypothetical protein
MLTENPTPRVLREADKLRNWLVSSSVKAAADV